MKRKQRLTSASRTPAKRAGRASARRRQARAFDRTAPSSRKNEVPFSPVKIADFYRPLKKPVTLRLDADVLAWFKKDGRRYQTRINSALRKVMEREMKGR